MQTSKEIRQDIAPVMQFVDGKLIKTDKTIELNTFTIEVVRRSSSMAGGRVIKRTQHGKTKGSQVS